MGTSCSDGLLPAPQDPLGLSRRHPTTSIPRFFGSALSQAGRDCRCRAGDPRCHPICAAGSYPWNGAQPWGSVEAAPASVGLSGDPTCPLGLGWAAGSYLEAEGQPGHLSTWAGLSLSLPGPQSHHVGKRGQGTRRSGCSTPGSHHAPLAQGTWPAPPCRCQGHGQGPPRAGCHSVVGAGWAPVPRKRAGVCAQLRLSGCVPLRPVGSRPSRRNRRPARARHAALGLARARPAQRGSQLLGQTLAKEAA